MSRRPNRSPSPAVRRASAPPPAPALARPAHLLACMVAAACVLVLVSFRLYDHDLWQHLVFGKAMAMLGHVPTTQIWTWPLHGTPLVNPSWAFSWLVYPFWQAGGDAGLLAWRWLTTLLAFGFAYATARALGARGITVLFVMVVCALVYRQRSQVRPETLAAVWVALTVFVLHAVPRRSLRDAALVLIGLAWANSHLSWYLGPVLVLLHAIGLRFAGEAARRHAPRLALVALAMLAVAFMNPFGAELVRRPLRYVLEWRIDPLVSGISELQSIDWAANFSNGLPLLLAGWPVLALARARRRGRDVTEWLTCAACTLLVFQGSRFVAIYALVAAPYVARDLDDACAAWRAWASAGAWRQAIAFVLLAPLACAYEWTHFENRFGVAPDMRRAPVVACDFIQAHGVRGRMLNDFYLGGYVLWRAWPDSTRLPFLDIHPEDAPRELRDAYLSAFQSRHGFESLDARWHFDHVLLSRGRLERPGLIDLMDRLPEWALVSVDDAAALYVRRGSALGAIADSFAYAALPGGGLALADLQTACAADTALARQVRGELARASASGAQTRLEPLRQVCEQGITGP